MSNEILINQNHTPKAEDSTEKPAIGLIATAENSGSIARNILRATEEGHRVFVTYEGTPNIEAVRFADKLGAQVVTPDVEDPTIDDLQKTLTNTSQALSLPGLIVHTGRGRIDFDRSRFRQSESEYCVTAITESAQTSDDDISTVAAIPAYNEAGSIAEVVDDAREHADECPRHRRWQ